MLHWFARGAPGVREWQTCVRFLPFAQSRSHHLGSGPASTTASSRAPRTCTMRRRCRVVRWERYVRQWWGGRLDLGGGTFFGGA
eukprot:9253988-Alexandrium_andersonii.AAC.1